MADQPTDRSTALAALAEADAPQLLIEALEDMRRLLAENRRLRDRVAKLEAALEAALDPRRCREPTPHSRDWWGFK